MQLVADCPFGQKIACGLHQNPNLQSFNYVDRNEWCARVTQQTEERLLSSHVQDVTIPWVSPAPERHVSALHLWKPPWTAVNACGLPLPSLWVDRARTWLPETDPWCVDSGWRDKDEVPTYRPQKSLETREC